VLQSLCSCQQRGYHYRRKPHCKKHNFLNLSKQKKVSNLFLTSLANPYKNNSLIFETILLLHLYGIFGFFAENWLIKKRIFALVRAH